MQQIASDRTNACQGIYPLFKTMSESTHVPTPIKVSKLQIDKCSSIWEFHQNTCLNIAIMKDPKLRISALTYIQFLSGLGLGLGLGIGLGID